MAIPKRNVLFGAARAAAGVAWLLTAAAAIAHHSSAGVYAMDTIVELEGEVTEVLWRNPHVRFAIRTADGSVWGIETNSVSILRRMEIGPDVVAVGEHVKVAGSPSRRNDNELWVNNLLLADGREVVLRPGVEPRWTHDTVGTSAVWLARGTAAPAEQAGKPSIFRVWSTHFTGPDRDLWNATYPLTPAAAAARAAFDPLKDNPIADCRPKGMPWIMEQPYPMELVDRGDKILMRLEEYDTVRTFYMDPQAEIDTTPTRLGHSRAHWEDDTLVVETHGINWKYFNPTGIPVSDAIEIVERFKLSEDGSRLLYTMLVTDPVVFTEPVLLDKAWVWRPGEQVRPYECTNG
jgi:Family of unknown function (DUF6152)